jgi:hypothetical protein
MKLVAAIVGLAAMPFVAAAASRSEMSAMLESEDDMQVSSPPQEPNACSRSYSILQSTSQLLTMTYIVFLIT